MKNIDTVIMSLQAIRTNKLRSSLTLVGIVLGVASIIAVMTGISVVQGTMEKEMSVLGSQTFQVQKWPAGFSSEEERREAMKRPPMTLSDAQAIRDHVETVDIVGAEIWEFGFKAEYKGEETNDNIAIVGGTPEYPQNNTHFVGLGRNISQMDIRSASRNVVIGFAIAQRLFPFVDPIGREIRVDGRQYRVIGVFDEKKSAFNSTYDSYILMPVTTFLNTYGDTDRNGFARSVNITVHAKSPDVVADAIEETRTVLRRVRGVARGEPDNRLRHRHHRPAGCRHRHHEYHAGVGHRTHQGDRHPQGPRRQAALHTAAVPARGRGPLQRRRHYWRHAGFRLRQPVGEIRHVVLVRIGRTDGMGRYRSAFLHHGRHPVRNPAGRESIIDALRYE
jgi:hypothetical protein